MLTPPPERRRPGGRSAPSTRWHRRPRPDATGGMARRRSLPPSMKRSGHLPTLVEYDDIISVPPATMSSSMPARTYAAAMLTAETAPAEAVQRDAAGAHVEAGVERGHTADVAPLPAYLYARAPDDVVDVPGIDSVALVQRSQHRGAQNLRVQIGQRPLADLPIPRGVLQRADDPGLGHVVSSMLYVARLPSARCAGGYERIKSIPNKTGKASRVGCSVPTGGGRQRPRRSAEMPGAAPDIMRDYDLATLGYSETEYSVEGKATAYELQGERGADGRWSVSPRKEATFRTRFVVRRPLDRVGSAARSSWNGTTCRRASTPHPTGVSSTATSRRRVTPGSACRRRRSASTAVDSSRAST